MRVTAGPMPIARACGVSARPIEGVRRPERDRRRERGDGCCRLRAGIATATVATRTSWFALPARLAASARAVA